MGAAKRFKNLSLPRQEGEYARLRVLQGPDYGQVFVVIASRITVGRGEDNDVILSDLKASRRHAEFRYEVSGWKVQDMGSANGILHNGKNTRAGILRPGDTITLGETTFEFLTSDVGTQVLTSPPSRALAVVEQAKVAESALEVHRQKIRSIANAESLPAGALFNNLGRANTGDAGPAVNKRRLLIYGGLGLLVAAMFLVDDKPDPKKAAEKSGAAAKPTNAGSLVAATRNAAGLMDGSAGEAKLSPEAEAFFRAGFREFRERNYIRATMNFDNVLMINPTHELSRKYQKNCKDAIDDEVKSHMARGRKNFESGRLKFAKGHYEAVLRLLFRNENDPSFQSAREELEKVEKRLKESGT